MAELTKPMAENRWYGPGPHFVNLAPDDVHNPDVVGWYRPFVSYDQALAQIGLDGAAQVGGDDGGGGDCAFPRALCPP